MAKKISAPQTSTGGKYLIRCIGNPTYAFEALTVAGQRRICTDFPKYIDYLVVGEINHHSTRQASRRYASKHGI
jgi:hypothetical protein